MDNLAIAQAHLEAIIKALDTQILMADDTGEAVQALRRMRKYMKAHNSLTGRIVKARMR